MSRRTALLITAIYAVVVGYLAWHHVLWRDEVRALNIAAGARSLGDLFALLRNEGHPPLWYLLLYAGYRVTHSMLILKPISLLCAAGAAYVFLRRAPFPIWQKVLFLCGVFPLFTYAVDCRSYGISMLLMFGVAALYKDRFTRPLPLCGVLALLANTNAYSLFITCALVLAIVVEALVSRPSFNLRALLEGSAGVLLLVAGIVVSALVMMPDARSTVHAAHASSSGDVVRALRGALAAPGTLYGEILGGEKLFLNILFWAVALYLLTRPWLLLAWIVTAVAFSMFSSLVYGASRWHLGLFYIFFLVLLWIDQVSGEGLSLPVWLARMRQGVARHRDTALALLLLTQACIGFGVARKHLNAPNSSSEGLGRYLTGSPALRDAIVVAEPDVMVEALPYYAPNRIFLPREGKYMIKVSFTIASRPNLSLDELLDTAEKLRSETGRPVLLVIQHPLSPNGPFVINRWPGREFHYSAESLQRFLSRTVRLAVFDRAISDENYVLFQLR